MFEQLRKLPIESPEAITEHLTLVSNIPFRGHNDGMQMAAGSIWTFPDVIHRERRFFRLDRSLSGSEHTLRSGTYYEVEDVNFLRPRQDGLHLVTARIDANWQHGARFHSQYVVKREVAEGFSLDASQFVMIATNGIYDYLSGTRNTAEDEAVADFEATQRASDNYDVRLTRGLAAIVEQATHPDQS